MTIQELITELRTILSSVPGDDPARLARRVMDMVGGVSLVDQITGADRVLPIETVEKLRAVVTRLADGMPLSRILGTREFYGRPFILSPDTLDPRPETELLVDAVLAFMRDAARSNMTVLDLGTGTGCIGLTLAAEMPGTHVTLVDIADGALATARQNADALGMTNQTTLIRSNWFENVGQGVFDVIVSNPPYIPSRDILALDSNVRNHDPIRALDGGEDGLDPYRTLFPGIKRHLKPGGMAFVEIGINQATDVKECAVKSGLDVACVISDYAAIPRVVGVVVPT